MTHMEDIQSQQGQTLVEPLKFEPLKDDTPSNTLQSRLNSPLLKVAVVALVLALGLLSYLMAATSAHIETTPNARQLKQLKIEVDGLLTFKTGERFLLLPGEHSIHVSALGYHAHTEDLTIPSGGSFLHPVTLTPLPGHLTVNIQDTNANNTQGNKAQDIKATVTIDGEQAGHAGTEIRDIAAGKHQLSIQSPRHQLHTQSIDINGQDQAQQLDIALQPNWAKVQINTTPEGAQVFSDQLRLGTTPLNAELLAGKHQLMVKLAGYKSWRQTLRVNAEQAQTLPLIKLSPADGLVEVSSTPSGASVTVDGQYQGQTPLSISLAPDQSYRFTLFKDGFEAQHRRFSVDKVNTETSPQTLAVTLGASLGDIIIQATPSDALLYVDGRLMGRANRQLTLPARQHSLSIRKDGYASHDTQILPRPDLAQTLKVSLLTTDQDLWKKIPRRYTNTGGQALMLFRPDVNFTMGASRRQQGRRSNEVQRQVKLKRGFYLSEAPVSNAQYRQFERFHSSGHVKGNSLNGDHYPVVNVTWEKAAAYCNWLSQQEKLTPFYSETQGTITGFNNQANGYRLPTEAEWAWGARYENGAMITFPWGKTLPPAPKSGNYGDRSAAKLLGNILLNFEDGYKVTAPLKSFPPNSKKLYGFGGNTAEWAHDFYAIKTGLSLVTEVDPSGPEKGDYHVIRGSSWAHATMTELRLAFRDYHNQSRYDVGFRVARYAQ